MMKDALMNEATKFLNTEQAAEYLTLKPSTLEAWRSRGGGPVFLKFGGAVRYTLQDLDAYIDGRACTHTMQHSNVVGLDAG
jgi:hypothetical protein